MIFYKQKTHNKKRKKLERRNHFDQSIYPNENFVILMKFPLINFGLKAQRKINTNFRISYETIHVFISLFRNKSKYDE